MYILPPSILPKGSKAKRWQSFTPPQPDHPAATVDYFRSAVLTHSRLMPIIEIAKTIERHWDGVLRWFQSKIANGLLEGINSLIRAAKAKARVYRSIRNLQAIIYLIAGKLDMRFPT